MRLEFGDTVFYAIAGLVVIVLFWLRFVEAHIGLWGALAVWLAWTVFLVHRYRKGRDGGNGPDSGATTTT